MKAIDQTLSSFNRCRDTRTQAPDNAIGLREKRVIAFLMSTRWLRANTVISYQLDQNLNLGLGLTTTNPNPNNQINNTSAPRRA